VPQDAVLKVDTQISGDFYLWVLEMDDRRQSEAAWRIVRGVMRMWRELGHASLAELTLANGRRADVLSLNGSNRIFIVEVKSSPADFRSDEKWQYYMNWCDEFYFAVDENTPQQLVPLEAGLILADGFGAEIIRLPALRAPLVAARRKAITLRFAQAGAWRLQAQNDRQLL
jgi:hypothetical protein